MNLIEQCTDGIARFEDGLRLKIPVNDTLADSKPDTQVLQTNAYRERNPPTLMSWIRLASGRAAGIVFNHPCFCDGTKIRTSLVVVWEERLITTRNRTYVLGDQAASNRNLSHHSERTRKKAAIAMRMITTFFVGVLASFVIGCGGTTTPEPSSSPVELEPKGNQESPTTEDQDATRAKELLKASLDSWVFGDSEQAWKQSHPNVLIIDERGSIRPFDLSSDQTRPAGSYPRIKLLEFEIGMSRGGEKKPGLDFVSYEFVVTLHAQDQQGNDIKRNQNYSVSRMQGKWTIMRLVAKD